MRIIRGDSKTFTFQRKDKDKEKFKNEKTEKYKIQLNLYEKMLKQEENKQKGL